MMSREVRLVNRPEGLPEEDDFQIAEAHLPDPTEGEVLVENLCMSVDPYMRGRMLDRKSYVPPFQLGAAMTGAAVGVVLASRAPELPEGSHVLSMYGWRDAFVAKASKLRSLGELRAPASAYLGVLGMPGLTAYAGMLEVGGLKEDDRVFVSGAAGAVGSIAGQIARIKGCHVVGSAGSEEKVRHLQEDLGFDVALDYHGEDLMARLREAAPEGIDLYFDNVGGEHLEAALACMRPRGRIAMCGAIAQYNDAEPPPGPKNLVLAIALGLTMRGFIVTDYNHLQQDFERDMLTWLESGALRYTETIHDTLDSAPKAFLGLFSGANTGKMVVRLREA